MVKVFPFRGLTYNKKKLKDLSRVMSPPYDVVGPEQRDDLYSRSEFNFIRIILGKDFNGDNDYNNRYVRAAAFLNGWLRHKILLFDDKPALYLYEQKFSLHGLNFSRLGFIALLRLEDMGRGKVFPHEETYPKAKLDRLQLMRATNANLDPIFAFYSDDKEKVVKALRPFMKKKPALELKDSDKVVHRLWKIDRKPTINKIIKEMKDKAAFIADGHHRYEAAIRYKNELKEKNTKFTEDEVYNHVMTYFTPLESKGLVILPIHRVITNLAYFDAIRFEQDLSLYFNLTPYPATRKNKDKVMKKLMKDVAKAADKHAFGLYLGDGKLFMLTLRDEKDVEEMVAEEKPKAWKKLDVTILHYVVFDRLLNIAQETEDKVTYTQNEEEALKLVDDKGALMAFILNPTRAEEIVAIASELEKMPHKSTFFYPKLLSGLIINRFTPGEKIQS